MSKRDLKGAPVSQLQPNTTTHSKQVLSSQYARQQEQLQQSYYQQRKSDQQEYEQYLPLKPARISPALPTYHEEQFVELLNESQPNHFQTSQALSSFHQEPQNILLTNNYFTCADLEPSSIQEPCLQATFKVPARQSRKELLNLTIEIAEGHNETILIREGDDPNRLAFDFSIKHGLDSELERVLADQITQNMAQIQQNTSIAFSNENEQANYQTKNPFNESYQKWQKEINHDLKTQNGVFYDRPQINSTSKHLAEQKMSSATKIPVHERLYQRSSKLVEDKPKNVNKPPIPSGPNYGEKLYQRGVKQREERERTLSEARSVQQRQELEQATFHPITNMNDFQRTQKTEDILINYGKRKREKQELQQRQKSQSELEEFDFNPKILKYSEDRRRSEQHSQRSEQNSSQRSHRKTKFESLYEDAKRRNERQLNIYSACINSECTFKPEISKKRLSNSASRPRDPQLFERLSQGLSSSRERSQLLLAHSQTLSNDLYDPETGQTLFRPKTNRNPLQKVRNSEQAGNHLYKQSRQEQARLQIKKVEALQDAIKKSNTVFTTEHTNKIVNQKKQQAFTTIFNLLDSDCDGYISSMKIDISNIDTDLLEVLSPLLIELEELNQPLNREEFLDALERLHESQSLPMREILLLKSKKKRQQELPSFKPKINENSRQIAKELHRGRSSVERLSQPRRPVHQKPQHEVKMFTMPNRLEESLRLGRKVDLDDLALKIAQEMLGKDVFSTMSHSTQSYKSEIQTQQVAQ